MHFDVNLNCVLFNVNSQITAFSILNHHIHMQAANGVWCGVVWYGMLNVPGEAFGHEATSQVTQNSTDTSRKRNEKHALVTIELNDTI